MGAVWHRSRSCRGRLSGFSILFAITCLRIIAFLALIEEGSRETSQASLTTLEVVPNLTEEQVADIFTRINSKGTVLKQADFILTLLSVFWEKGREEIDEFCRQAKRVPEKKSGPSPFNYIFEPSPTDLIRIIVGLGFGRGKMKDAYSILSGRDFTTKKVSATLREEQFEAFKMGAAAGS